MPKSLISVGQLIDHSWDVYRTRFNELMTISGWLILTAVFYALALAFYPSASTMEAGIALSSMESFGVIFFMLTTMIIAPIMSFWIYTSLARALSVHFAGRKPNPKKAMTQGKKAFVPALITSAMVMLMMLLAIVIGFGPAVVLATIGSLLGAGSLVLISNILLLVGIFVAVFLTAKWMVYYILAPLITIIDGDKGKVALKKSRALIEGRFWGVLIRIAVPKLVFVIFGIFAMVMVGHIGSILIDVSGGISLDLQLRITTMTQTIVPIVIAAFINPLLIISDVLLLRSLNE
jgi:hypothetical protein